jgi:hypothetical protein
MVRDLHKTIAHIEHTLTRGLDRRPAAPPREQPKPSLRSLHAPASNTVYPSEQQQVIKPESDMPMPTKLTVTARALKVTAILDTATVAALPVSDGQSRSQLAVAVDGKLYSADIATKSLRKCKSTIAAQGSVNVVVIIQGKLKNNEITECGLVAQVKQTKEESK